MSNIQWIFAGVIYLAPWIAAVLTRKSNAAGIFVLNLALGWTGFGWIAAVIWAVVGDVRPERPHLVAPGALGFVFGDETAPRAADVKYSETILADDPDDRAPGIRAAIVKAVDQARGPSDVEAAVGISIAIDALDKKTPGLRSLVRTMLDVDIERYKRAENPLDDQHKYKNPGDAGATNTGPR